MTHVDQQEIVAVGSTAPSVESPATSESAVPATLDVPAVARVTRSSSH